MGKRLLVFLYGATAYVMFLGTFLYAIGFVMELLVPKTINTGAETPLEWALLINVGILGVFGIQHSIMARPAFKRWWTTIIPKAAERSTFVLLTNIILCTLYWQWRPMPDVVWQVDHEIVSTALLVVAWIGWGIVLLSTYLIDHFGLFGLKQVWYCLRDEPVPEVQFKERLFYKWMRHPLMFGFMLAFWSTPRMTLGHLVFALVTTAYVLVALQLEERDLIKAHGESYRDYRRRVPMLFPRIFGRRVPSVPVRGVPDSESLAGV